MTARPTGPEPEGLFPEPVMPDGEHAARFRRAFTAAEDARLVSDVDAALMSVALAGAAALDRAEAMPPNKSVYPIAQLLGPTREVLESLKLSPTVRDSDVDDDLKDALRELNAATDDTDDTADADPSVPHSEDTGH